MVVTTSGLDRTFATALPRGHVHLVGAGPGDPELLTLRAHRLVTTARVVAYDELVGPAILALVPADAERIAVGRRKGTCPAAPSIHPAVLERALAGHDVVRLKGGDPMIFGRGGEEAAELAALRIPFSIVPGVSAALGAAASTGIPLTHRDASASVTFATAHLRHSAPDPEALPKELPRTGTLVLYMGIANLAAVAAQLVADGRPARTPAAVISHATLPTEQVVVADLSSIAERAGSLPTPALVVIGDVVDRRVVPSEIRERALHAARTHMR